MNKREREAVAALVAGWEWIQGGSSSEASARNFCARDLIETLAIPDDDLNFARAYEIAKNAGFTDDETAFDALIDKIEDDGYDAVVSLIEESGFRSLRAVLLKGPADEQA